MTPSLGLVFQMITCWDVSTSTTTTTTSSSSSFTTDYQFSNHQPPVTVTLLLPASASRHLSAFDGIPTAPQRRMRHAMQLAHKVKELVVVVVVVVV